MLDLEKAQKVAEMLSPEVVDGEDLLPYIDLAEEIVLNRRFPFGYKEGTKVPKKYENIQCQIALQLWNMRGAEGQTSHSENGINREWVNLKDSPFLKLVVPYVGSVVLDDASSREE